MKRLTKRILTRQLSWDRHIIIQHAVGISPWLPHQIIHHSNHYRRFRHNPSFQRCHFEFSDIAPWPLADVINPTHHWSTDRKTTSLQKTLHYYMLYHRYMLDAFALGECLASQNCNNICTNKCVCVSSITPKPWNLTAWNISCILKELQGSAWVKIGSLVN